MPKIEGLFLPENLLKDVTQDADPLLRSYMIDYIRDETNEKTFEELFDFLQPLLSFGAGLDEVQIVELCSKLSEFFYESGGNDPAHLQLMSQPVMLKNKLGLNREKNPFRNEIGDVALVQHAHRTRASIVDRKKLIAAEKKLAQKRTQRRTAYTPGIPWDISQRAQMMVSQTKSAPVSSTSKNIKLQNFEIKYATTTILEGANLSLSCGRRYGLIGKNGVGKSTLLMALASGELNIPAGIRVQHIQQTVNFGSMRVLDVVIRSNTRQMELMEEEEALVSSSMNTQGKHNMDYVSSRLATIYSQLKELDSDSAEARAISILTGLGFSKEQQESPANTLSGGWRMRLSIAISLFIKHDLLLADEITNFLDFPAISWLEKHLCAQKSILLLVSHDRAFLDNVVTDIIHMHDGTLDAYKGNFSSFAATMREMQKNKERTYETQMEYKKHLQDFVNKRRCNANTASQAQSKLKIIQKLDQLETPKKNLLAGISRDGQYSHFSFESPESSFHPLLQLDDITYGYTNDKIILQNVNFGVFKGSKIAIVGPNGCGKSTLFSILVKNLNPVGGCVKAPGGLKVGYLAQHHENQLNSSVSPVNFLLEKLPGITPEECRSALAKFGILGTTALQPLGTLSGGQKSRCSFTYLSLLKPHILLLDEPTNHLDMDFIDAFAHSLKKYKGGLVIISHDEAFLDQVCNEVYVFKDKKFVKFDTKEGVQKGAVKQYKESLN